MTRGAQDRRRPAGGWKVGVLSASLTVALWASPAMAAPVPDLTHTIGTAIEAPVAVSNEMNARAGSEAFGTASPVSATAPAGTRNGREIYERFREGLADPDCDGDASTRWRQHFATAPKRLASRNDDALPLFGYVVDALRAAHLPTEYALIPFVESGYQPAARSGSGPTGLWQLISVTARNHDVPMRGGYDGRLSPVESTEAAVRYLKTLHGMFAGDWRLAVMAYNAGEYRVFNALKRGGLAARDASPEQVPGLSDTTQAYVRKLHALSCLIEQAGEEQNDWLKSLDRPVPYLQAVTVPDDVDDLQEWAARSGQSAEQLRRLNPAFASGKIGRHGGERAPILAVASGSAPTPGIAVGAVATAPQPVSVSTASGRLPASPAADAATGRRHTVARGESAWTIARRYGLSVAELLERNALRADTVLSPGQLLQIDLRRVAE